MDNKKYFSDLPRDLLFDGLFCAWKLVEGKGKIPYNPKTHLPTKTNDQSTFLSFFEIKSYIDDAIKESEEGKLIGGIGFGIFNGYSAIDIDHCVDENGCISDFALEIIEFFKSYTEFSPSGTGIHIIFRNALPFYDANKYYIHNDKLEIYVSGATKKYLTLSANNYKYKEIQKIDITPILEKYMKRPNAVNPDGDLTSILQKDIKFAELWNSKASGSGGNESETDLALINKIMFYTKCNKEKAKAIFEMSPYFATKDEEHIKKWNNGYYAEHTLEVSYSSVRQNIINRNIAAIDPLLPQEEKVDTSTNYSIDSEESILYLRGTDDYNARLFAKRFAKKYKYNVDNKRWMVFNGKYWQTDVENRIRIHASFIGEVVRSQINDKTSEEDKREILKMVKYLSSSRGVDNLLKESQALMPISNSDLDKDEFIISTLDGYYNLREDKLEEFDYKKNISQTTNQHISFEEPTLWVKFLKDILNNDEELYNYLHKALGYSITESAREQCLFILYGDGNNGKSLLLNVVNYVLGTYGISTAAQTILKNKWGDSNSNTESIARMKGKRFCVLQEPEMNQFFDESKIKTLTSGNDEQTARFLYGNSFNFTFKGKMWIGTNYLPNIRGIDIGIKRRMRIIHLKVDFTGKEDKDLQYKLLEEAPKILGWLIEGFRKYIEEGLNETEEMQNAKKEYFYNNDVVERWINEQCDLSMPECESSASLLFRYFKDWAKENEGREYTQTTFGRQMAKKFEKYRARGGNIVYKGIRLNENAIHKETTYSDDTKQYKSIDLFDLNKV